MFGKKPGPFSGRSFPRRAGKSLSLASRTRQPPPDLPLPLDSSAGEPPRQPAASGSAAGGPCRWEDHAACSPCGAVGSPWRACRAGARRPPGDRKSVVSGTSGSVRVDFGGRGIIKQNKKNELDVLVKRNQKRYN